MILMGIMGALGAQYPALEDSTLARVNVMREQRKLGPLDKNVWGSPLSKQEAARD